MPGQGGRGLRAVVVRDAAFGVGGLTGLPGGLSAKPFGNNARIANVVAGTAGHLIRRRERQIVATFLFVSSLKEEKLI